jgi:NAD(P)-dependent dehydrogenase (short-subunit alcohol dehydrogenase family)
VDLSLAPAPAHWVATAAAAIGGVDILISNAGRNFFAGAATCSGETWQANMNLNLTAHWRLAQAAYPFLTRSNSQPVIIIITSNHAYYTLPGSFPYNISKAGLLAMVQSLAIEWGPHIRTVGIAPGFVDTPGNEAWFNTFANPAAQRTRTEQLHPVGRIGTAAEIGALCAFLASPWSSFISGSTILIDGGRSALMQDPVSDDEGPNNES